MLECHKETGFSNTDTATTQTIGLHTSGVKFVAKLTNFSDGTGETLVKKIDGLRGHIYDRRRKQKNIKSMVLYQYIKRKVWCRDYMGPYNKCYCYVIRW